MQSVLQLTMPSVSKTVNNSFSARMRLDKLYTFPGGSPIAMKV